MTTVRPLTEVAVASDRCQRWSDGRHSFVRRSAGGFDASRYSVERIDHATASTYVTANHYLSTFPADKVRFGLYFDDPEVGRDLVGVAVYGIPASRRVLTNLFPDLEPYVESLELSRLVLEGDRGQRGGRAPANAEGWFVSRCHSELAATGVRGVVAFADPVPRRTAAGALIAGHVGIVYQSRTAVYCGRATPRTLTVLPDGCTLSDRSLQKVRRLEQGHAGVERRLVAFGASVRRDGQDPARWLQEALLAVGATRLRHRGNHRYAFRLGAGPAARRQVRVALAPQPYPKQPDTDAPI